LKMAGRLMKRSFKVVVKLILLWGSRLVDMYAKCRSIEDAQRVFNKMPSHNMVTWTPIPPGHGIGTCEMWASTKVTEHILTNATWGCVTKHSYFCEGAECMCQHSFTWKRGGLLMSRSFKEDGIQMTLWGIAWLTCMQNVGAWRILRECSDHQDAWKTKGMTLGALPGSP
jgi:hypothetical protein